MYTYIKTIGQLKQHLGDIVVSYYFHQSPEKEKWRPEREEEEPLFMWMFKLVDDGENYSRYKTRETIKYKLLFGINHICLKNDTPYKFPIVDNITPHIMYHSDGDKFDLLNPIESSAQTYMRFATRDEIKLYNRLTRKRKILGHD